MEFPNDWWRSRKDELMALVNKKCPLYVYNEETLNDTFFDFLSIKAIDGLFYPVNANPHPEIIKKTFEMDVGFKCISYDEINRVLNHFPKISPKRMLFVPDNACGEDFERAFRYGAQIVVEDFKTLKAWPNIFKNMEIIISTYVGYEQVVSKASVKGFYVHSETNFPPLCDLNEKVSFVVDVFRHFPEVPTLILGNGMNLGIKHEKGIMDIPAIGEYLEALKDVCPRLALWLDPGHHMVSHAGVLLAMVTEIDKEDRIRYVRLNTEMETPVYNGLHGTHHEVINLSKSDEEAVLPFLITRQDNEPGNNVGYLKGPSLVEKGDILLFKNMGAYGTGEVLSEKGRNSIAEHYLSARRVCPVRIS